MSTAPAYFSDFGGLWTDRSDADRELDRRLADGRIDEHQAEQLRDWMRNGYVILPGAVPVDAIDRFHADIVGAFEHGDERLMVARPGVQGYEPLRAGTSTVRARVVDGYAFYPSAADLLFADAIVDWLELVFDAQPLLFQSLSFDRGSQQGMHQDTAYVVVDRPLELAASWIALEDVTEGSGELMYLEGSHRLPEYKFSGEHKHWNHGRDGDEQHSEWGRGLLENAERLGFARKTFLPRKGDVLIWAADLAHGGAPAQDESLTRRSLVGHYCPPSASPNYFSYRDDRSTVRSHGRGLYSSEHYDLAAASTPPPDNAPPPPDPPPERRRSGGLVGRIRELVGR